MKKITWALLVVLMCATNAMAQQFVPVLEESFAKTTSTTIGGGYFAESFYFDGDSLADNKGWFTRNTYPSERAIKLGTKSKTGYAVTPKLNLTNAAGSDIKVSFRAQLWFTGTTKDTTRVVVQIEGDDATKQYVDVLNSTSVVDRTQPKYELTFNNVKPGAQLRFTAEKENGVSRFFLTEIVVSEKRDGNTTPVMDLSARYHKYADMMCGDKSSVKTIDVTAANLSEDIDVNTAYLKNFTVEKNANWDNRKGGRLNITFTPATAGDHTDSLTIGSYKVYLRGKSKVYAPVAAEATNVSDKGFTANWEAVAGASNYVMKVYTKEEAPLRATNLMISKYIEGKSNNRALQVFNGTGKAVNLKNYSMKMEVNGAGGVTANEFRFPDVTLDNGKTYTIANANINIPAIRNAADTLIGFQNGGYANIVTFTGDDAIGLFENDKLIDLIGYEDMDVNDRVSGDWGTDKTFYRKSSVYMPSNKFVPKEWNEYEKDYAEGFMTHSIDANGLVMTAESNDTINGNEKPEATISGLQPGTTYYYKVYVQSAYWTTPYSNEIEVTTQTAGIDDAQAIQKPYTLNGNLLTVNAAGVSVYTVNGLKLQPKAGTRQYRLNAHGVYIVSGKGVNIKLVR